MFMNGIEFRPRRFKKSEVGKSTQSTHSSGLHFEWNRNANCQIAEINN